MDKLYVWISFGEHITQLNIILSFSFCNQFIIYIKTNNIANLMVGVIVIIAVYGKIKRSICYKFMLPWCGNFFSQGLKAISVSNSILRNVNKLGFFRIPINCCYFIASIYGFTRNVIAFVA